jgi:glycosyltransferase involved in cell wall biosynthesis
VVPSMAFCNYEEIIVAKLGKFFCNFVRFYYAINNNVGNILDAAALLEDDNDIQFLIYGDGSEKEVLEKRIVDEGLSNVKMKGFINKQFIPYILSKSSVGNLINGLVYQIFQPFIDFIGLVPSADTVLIHFLLFPGAR